MSLEVMVQCLSSSDTEKNIQAQVVLQSAPVLKNVRMSCMFTMPGGSFRAICSSLYNTGVRIHCLCRGRGREVLLLYREERLDGYLKQEEVAAFLQCCGYQTGSLRQQLQRLGKRIAGFYNKTQGFPHEMGLFLGYPLEDVRGFIEHRGEQSKCTGYWKVYSNEERAKRMFRIFDEAKVCAMEEFFSGKNLREIAC
ncbi:MAG: DUF3793 family protein [Clostridiales bacterium]|nr:DUF3793 family protein [Clostridiales bacterium]